MIHMEAICSRDKLMEAKNKEIYEQLVMSSLVARGGKKQLPLIII